MGRPMSEKELKRFGRVLAGHNQDKDRERRKRKLKGQVAAPNQRRKPAALDGDDAWDQDEGADEDPA